MSKSALDILVVRVTNGLAVFAGLVLCVMAILTVVSIIGRGLIPVGLGPIPGDFELVEIGAAIAVFSVFPYCHLNRGHVTVDFLVNALPTWAFNVLTLIGDTCITLITLVIAWRLWFGLQEKIAYGETTMILGAPLWLGYSLSFIAAVWGGAVTLYVLWRDLKHLRAGVRLS